jgi:excisionase family DNA binding protein
MDEQSRFCMEEAADRLGCSPYTLRDRVTRGEVPHHRSGRRKGVYFTQEDLDEILAGQARRATARGTRAQATAPRTKMTPTEIPAEFAVLRSSRSRS